MEIKVKDSLRVAKLDCLNLFKEEFPKDNPATITVLEENDDRFLILIKSSKNSITFDYER